MKDEEGAIDVPPLSVVLWGCTCGHHLEMHGDLRAGLPQAITAHLAICQRVRGEIEDGLACPICYAVYQPGDAEAAKRCCHPEAMKDAAWDAGRRLAQVFGLISTGVAKTGVELDLAAVELGKRQPDEILRVLRMGRKLNLLGRTEYAEMIAELETFGNGGDPRGFARLT